MAGAPVLQEAAVSNTNGKSDVNIPGMQYSGAGRKVKQPAVGTPWQSGVAAAWLLRQHKPCCRHDS